MPDTPPTSAASMPFGTHANADPCPYKGRLNFGPDGEDGLPDTESHADGSPCPACCEYHSAVGCTDDPPYGVCCLNCPINGASLRAWREKVIHG